MNFRSCRRILIDKDLEGAKKYKKGLVLDVGGGQKQALFKKLKEAKWIVFDINKELSLDILGGAHNLPIKSDTIDCVKCTVSEHVESQEKVVKEIERILRPSGHLILSVPVNCESHGDPYDSGPTQKSKPILGLAKKGRRHLK